MAGIKVNIGRVPTLDVPRFTRNEMRAIGQSVADAEVTRIRAATKPDGMPAAPLSVTLRNGRRSGYAVWKTRKGGRNVRDWYGPPRNPEHMLDVLKVTVADVTRAIIKFPASVAKRAVIRETKDEMFDLSKPGEEAGTRTARSFWDKAVKRSAR